MTSRYEAIHPRSLANPDEFWAEAAAQIDWYKTWDKVLDDTSKPFYRWFAGAELNTCYNALDRHVDNGRSEQAALIYDSPVTGTKRTYTYRELRDAVAQLLVDGDLRRRMAVEGERIRARDGKTLAADMIESVGRAAR